MERVTLKVSQMLAAYNALQSLALREMEDKQFVLPAKGQYWVGRLRKKLEPEFKAAEERRTALIKEFGTGDDQNGYEVKDPEKLAKFLEKWKPIGDESIEVEAPLIPIDYFGDVKIPIYIMDPLEKFIKE